jgi:hypothetical protein
MLENDPKLYSRMLRRVTWLILTLGLLGAVALAAWKGWRTGYSFLTGALVSYLSFWRWQRVVEALTAESKKRQNWFYILRIVLLGALAWVIIKYLGLNLAAATSGLLVSAAAVVLEIIYELIYAS